jgi:serine/threonine protein phosphatase PrpC
MARLPCFGAATGSSKPPRRSTGERPPNEDRWTAHSMDDAGLYGVFDGHGGDGAAEFVANHLPELVRTKLQCQLASGSAVRRKDVVSSVLAEAFLAADSALYQRVRSQRVSPQAKHRGTSSRCSRCRMYREKPCICTGVALPANVGSTGSLVHVRNSTAVGQATCVRQGPKALTLLVCV